MSFFVYGIHWVVEFIEFIVFVEFIEFIVSDVSILFEIWCL